MIRTLAQLKAILDGVRFHNWEFFSDYMDGGYYIQVRFIAPDNHTHELGLEQRGRKWYVSAHSTPNEVVQTCLKAVLTALEHEAREQFTYKGVSIFQPHMDLDALVEQAKTKIIREEVAA